MRGAAVIVAVVALLAACGTSSDEAPSGAPPGSLAALQARAGEDVGLVFGTSDYEPGLLRVSFLVLRGDARQVERPTARVWLARDLDAAPFARGLARLERIGARESVYVTEVRVREPGTYWLLAEPVGAAVQGVGSVAVRERTRTPAVGAEAVPSRTPTLRDAPADRLSTADPPHVELLRVSVAEALDGQLPFVLVFATPAFCESRTCGPVVEIADVVRRRLEPTDVRFIHVEIYEENQPALGVNRWVREWKLPSEPWIFLVGRDGRIKAKFEGPVSERELRAAVQRFLT